MRYISLFSGIGGLESNETDPLIVCEKNSACINFLEGQFKNSIIVDDIKKLTKNSFKLPKVDIVTGGWPCQDISVGGTQKGFKGEHSVLFYELIKVAKKAKAELIIAENVPNLLNIEKGAVFSSVLSELAKSGYKYISWRILNTREFNLPHQRRRIFIYASKTNQLPNNLFNSIKIKIKQPKNKLDVHGFYHTAGTHSICFSKNYVPTLKVSGSGPAIFYKNTMRRLTANESLKLQGFKPSKFKNIPMSHIFSMTGNAVSKPIGEFLFACVKNNIDQLDLEPLSKPELAGFGSGFSQPKRFPENGIYKNGAIYEVKIPEKILCSNLADFIDFNSNEFLSTTAILGILRRTAKAGKYIDNTLLDAMIEFVSLKSLTKEIGAKNISKLYQSDASIEERFEDEELNFNL